MAITTMNLLPLKHHRFVVWLFTLIVLLLPIKADAIPKITLENQGDNQVLSPSLEILEDPSGQLTFQEVISPQYAEKFTVNNNITTNMGYSQSFWWLRFDITSQTQKTWYLLVDHAISGEIDLFIYPHAPNSKFNSTKLFNRLNRHRTPAWQLNLPAGENFTVYLRANNGRELLYLPITLMLGNDFINHSNYQTMFFMMVFSGLTILAIFNAFFFFSLREFIYLDLVFVIIGLQFYFLHDSHFFSQFELTTSNSQFYLWPFFIALSSACHYWRFINQGGNKALEYLLKIVQFSGLILFPIINLVMVNNVWFYQFLILFCPLVFILITYAVLQEHNLTREYYWPILFIVPSCWFYALTHAGWLVIIETSIYIFQLCTLVTFTLMSILQMKQSCRLREQIGKIEALNKAKDEFFSIMSHELRTPMNAVVGISGLMHMTPLNNEQQDYLSKLTASSRHMLRLIDNILDLSHISQTGFKLTREPFQLTEVLNDIKNILYAQANQKGLDLVCHHRCFGNDQVIGDRTRLIQVLLNLAANAIKFTERGRIDIFIREQDSTSNDIALYFEIRDTGIGISKAHLKQLFNPFYQADSSTKKRYGGSGLGLVISQRIIQAMDSHLQVESELGQGSRFFFTLKMARFSEPLTEQQSVLSPPITSRFHILLVDDDEINCFVARRFLEARQIQVTVAMNAQKALEALQIAKSQPFAIILMDVSMPDMDGYETTRKIRDLGYDHIPIIALTAHAIIGERERCLAAGMDDFFTKPFELHELEQIVYKWAKTT